MFLTLFTSATKATLLLLCTKQAVLSESYRSEVREQKEEEGGRYQEGAVAQIPVPQFLYNRTSIQEDCLNFNSQDSLMIFLHQICVQENIFLISPFSFSECTTESGVLFSYTVLLFHTPGLSCQ